MRTCITLICCLMAYTGWSATFYVDNSAANASDDNPGTKERPWKTISRAGGAEELEAGDTVLIGSGVYREHVKLEVSGEENNPITFAAAPGARVVIKGSEVITEEWEQIGGQAGAEEPFPNAYRNVWKTILTDRYFTDERFAAAYKDKSRRWVSQVFINDDRALQRIGRPRIYRNDEYRKIRAIGHDLADIIDDSFYFDPEQQALYISISGNPSWYSIEVGVRGFALTASEVHDLVIRGLEIRHNRQPGGQWPMVSISRCERIRIEQCKVYQADFAGLSLGACTDCTVVGCDFSYNGCNGVNMGHGCENCVIDSCTITFNNYRHFHSGWAAAGSKCIPDNSHCTFRNCEVAYNIGCHGIWFDSGNEDIRIIGNVCHDNGGCGIFFEINKGGGIIADNLVYANGGRGIYISGSQNTWIVHNTVACNETGIICMPRGEDWPLENVHVRNNLLIRNYITSRTPARGCDLTLYMGPEPETHKRTVTSNHSDYNIYANASWTPTMRHHWNPNNTLNQWVERYGEDEHSKVLPIQFVQSGTRFRLETEEGLDAAGSLPDDLDWEPEDASRVGSSITHWP